MKYNINKKIMAEAMPWQLLDNFIHDHYQEDANILYKARLLAGILAGAAISIMVLFLFFFLIDGLNQQSYLSYGLTGVAGTFVWLALLYILKTSHQSFLLIAHLSIFIMTAILFSSIAITGGPLTTEIHPLLSGPCVIAFLLLGGKQGAYWSLAIFSIFIILSIGALNNLTFYNLAPDSLRITLRIAIWCYAFLVIAALAYLYELISATLLYKSERQRQRYKHVNDIAVDNRIIHDTVSQLSTAGETLLNSTIHQKAAIEQLALTTEELLATSADNLQNATSSMNNAQLIKTQLIQCHQGSTKLSTAMQEIQASNEQIQTINNVINDITQQTSLLSLNAMIEASRLEAENSGFHVVALEVKKLAERSVAAVSDINAVLMKNTEAVEQGLLHTKTLDEQLQLIQLNIDPVTQTSQQVVEGCNEQNLAIEQVNHSVQQIDEAIANNRKLAMNSTLLADDMQEETAKIKKLAEEIER